MRSYAFEERQNVMKSAKYHVLGLVLLIAAAGLGAQAKAAKGPAADAVRQRRAFLEGALFAAKEKEAVLYKPPVSFNTKDVLAGIEGVEVVVEALPPVAEKYGLRKQDLQADVEQQLRGRRIAVVEKPQTQGRPAQNVPPPEEPNEVVMRMVNAKSDESFLQDVRTYLQQREPESSSAILDISINAVADEAAGFASYSVHVQFLQTVVLLGPDPRRSLATTWQMATVGYVSLTEFKKISDQVRDAVAAFISDFLEANPDKNLDAAVPKPRVPRKGLVTGIVRSGDSSTAVIGTQIVREGETIDGVTIVRIYDDRVEFEKGGQRWTQRLNQPPGPQWK
jgi:hypothetical protein